MKTVKWYKYGVFWRRGDGDDDHSAQDHDDGWIDFIYNSLTKYRRYRDTGPDAVQCLIESAELLRQGKRFPDELCVAAGKGALSVIEIQGESGKRLLIKEFLQGYKIPPGTILS